VEIEHHIERIATHRAGHRLRFRRVHEQVVAIDVGAIRRRSDEMLRAIGVRTRHDQHIDAFQQLGPLDCELVRKDERRLAARRLVPVLLPEDHDGRPLRAVSVRPRQYDERHRASLLRMSDGLDAHMRRGRRQVGKVGEDLRVAGKIGPSGGESRRIESHVGIRKLAGDVVRIGLHLRSIELRAGVTE